MSRQTPHCAYHQNFEAQCFFCEKEKRHAEVSARLDAALKPQERRIVAPHEAMKTYLHGPREGRALEFAVKVDWPELQLTEAQMLENARARAAGHPAPHRDLSYITVELPFFLGVVHAVEPDTKNSAL